MTTHRKPKGRGGPTQQHTAATGSDRSKGPGRRSIKVLVVDDVPTHQMILVKFLKNRGARVVVANDGREALAAYQDAAATDPFDIILMDLKMPLMDGLECTRHIRQLENKSFHTPIIAITAGALPGDRDACLSAGMDDYISKPFDLNDLAELISKHSSSLTQIS